MYNVGDKVRRIEDRAFTLATIIQVHQGEEISVELQYEEGGTGWWPVSAIERV